MDHSFQSNKKLLNGNKKALSLISDALCLLKMSASDHQCMRERREPQMSSNETLMSLTPHSHRLALLLEDVSDHTEHATELHSKHGKAWSEFLFSYEADTSALKVELQRVEALVRKDVEALTLTEEKNDESSSVSDYSDSRTESSSSDEEEDK